MHALLHKYAALHVECGENIPADSDADVNVSDMMLLSDELYDMN